MKMNILCLYKTSAVQNSMRCFLTIYNLLSDIKKLKFKKN